jgi:CRP-like cAMP-binding protein
MFEIKQFPKKQVITQMGEVENCIYVVFRGLLRKYFLKGEEEVITHIIAEGAVLTSGASFFKQQPSLYFVETLEPTTVMALSYANYQKLFSIDHRWEKAGRELIQDALLRKEFWILDNLMHTPRERFLHFVRTYPELLQRVPQKYLASFLNIQPETFSRLKHLAYQD